MMTSQYHFFFSFPEEIDGLIDFLFVRMLFLSVRPSKTIPIKKSDIKILVLTSFWGILLQIIVMNWHPS